MLIDIDFEVFRALTALRQSESDGYNDVIRRLLNLPDREAELRPGEVDIPGLSVVSHNALAPEAGGVWFSNVFLPNGTAFRATYKGKTYRAWIKKSQWVDESGIVRTSPSDAATSITGNNVNGWRFWFARRPQDEDWQRMDALKR